MSELGFEGVPLDRLCPAPAPDTRAPAPAPPTDDAGADDGAESVVRRMTTRLQRAHTAVLEAHRAVDAWRVGLMAPGTMTTPSAAPAPVAAVPGNPSRQDEVTAVLRIAAAAGPPPDAFTLTWYDAPPADPAGLRVRPEDGSGCGVHAGDRLVLRLRPAPGEDPQDPPVPRFPGEFRPPASSAVRRLSRAALEALAAGDFAGVFGPAHDQDGLGPDELPAPWPAPLLDEITAVDPRGGRYGLGLLTAVFRAPFPEGDDAPRWPWWVAAATEALRVHAFHLGLHLCLPGARVVPLPDTATHVRLPSPPGSRPGDDAPLRLAVEVTGLGLLPGPYVTADCRVTSGGRPVARLRGLGVSVRERPGPPLLPHPGRPTCRKTSDGARAFFHELHAARSAESPYPPYADTTGQPVTTPVRPRLPRAGLRAVDRAVSFHEGPGPGGAGSRLVTEYDVPADPWYCREAGDGDALPHLALMETSLQCLGVFTQCDGVAARYPDRPFVCRNLEGRARLLRAVDPRSSTVVQDCVLLSSAALPGAVIHHCSFELSTGGRAFYAGEAAHGYLTAEVLDLQQGLDDGREVPPWAEDRRITGALRPDLRADARLGRGRLAAPAKALIVPGGGAHGAGYVLCEQPVDPDDWFFDQHFAYDPVLPGSVGVHMLGQAVRAFALYTGVVGHLANPSFAPAVGEETRWVYRGQILRHHRRMRGEVHIREVRADGDGVLLLADGSVWRDGLRIHRVDNLALTARPRPGAAVSREDVR
ncbi:hypothetical protein [Streptomyces griseocarneus]|uniref:hypothetical protein n=1 Tax=Streptomyces griseocarneus TaxID=51201 RepID=UPI00167F1ADD|nr:hypothetical protein [Streptomyces griseocarneus]MBZ6478132.1 hypothetical protein [Streptomyces griseocarneus]GHG53602.1 hypothetical protein GCM10018779_15700 [Streptomyces griseocarneus]